MTHSEAKQHAEAASVREQRTYYVTRLGNFRFNFVAAENYKQLFDGLVVDEIEVTPGLFAEVGQ